MDRVCVLLSTYNGEKYLREQLESVLSQTNVEIQIIIRDDGSKDNTVSIVKEYQFGYPNITLLAEENCGVEKSFEELCLYAFSHIESEYYAFCDQDDVWFPRKLEKAIAALKKEQEPALFCCNQMITDVNLHPLRLMIENGKLEKWQHLFDTNFFVNRHGCTMVWNQSLNYIISQIKHNPIYTPVHDVWVSLVAQCCGKLILDDEPLQYYRVHASNASGLANSRYKRLKKGIRLWWMRDSHRNLYAQDCIAYFNLSTSISPGKKYLKKVACYREGWCDTIRLTFTSQIWMQGLLDGLFWAISVLLRKY